MINIHVWGHRILSVSILQEEAGYEVSIRGSHVSAYFHGYSDFMPDWQGEDEIIWQHDVSRPRWL